MTNRTRIFLAHTREDKPQVRRLYDDLKARGLDPWLDEVDLVPGQIWKVEIPKAIRQAGVFLAFLSSRSVGKVGYVQNEFRLALSAFGERPPGSIFLVPVRLDDCEVPDLQIPDRGLSLRDIHWVDLWQEGGFERLVSAIELTLGKRSESEPKPGTFFRDINAPWCPELVVIPPGEFMMGSSEPERRWALERKWVDREKPRHRVRIPEPFAVGKHAVTRGQFAEFVEATAHDMSGGCWIFTRRTWEHRSTADWCSPGFEQTNHHPVVCVSWEDAKAYAEWLGREIGQPYRLLSEAEWESACRAGTMTRYSWGDDPPTGEQANFGMNKGGTTAVGTYPPNPWGLYDMHGNVWEWVEDCWNDSYKGAPEDGSAWTTGDCSCRVLRGGSWCVGPSFLRSGCRSRFYSEFRYGIVGFRVARTL